MTLSEEMAAWLVVREVSHSYVNAEDSVVRDGLRTINRIARESFDAITREKDNVQS